MQETIANTKPTVDYEELAVAWHDGQYYNPATRHRRRLMIELIRPLKIKSVLEIGCGQPYFLQELRDQKKIIGTGTDVSRALITQNKKEFPEFNFAVLDIVANALDQKFDLIVASEVLEHVSDYQAALRNIAQMSNRYILITVPSPPVFPIDRAIGHYRHYRPEMMIQPLTDLGYRVRACYKWGFPFHNLYKYAINSIKPEKMRQIFAESKYSDSKRLISGLIYGLFFFNFRIWGFQLVILAEKTRPNQG